MKKKSYKRIKKYLQAYNEEMCKFFNGLYEQRQKERKKFEKKFIQVSSSLKSMRKTDGII